MILKRLSSYPSGEVFISSAVFGDSMYLGLHGYAGIYKFGLSTNVLTELGSPDRDAEAILSLCEYGGQLYCTVETSANGVNFAVLSNDSFVPITGASGYGGFMGVFAGALYFTTFPSTVDEIRLWRYDGGFALVATLSDAAWIPFISGDTFYLLGHCGSLIANGGGCVYSSTDGRNFTKDAAFDLADTEYSCGCDFSVDGCTYFGTSWWTVGNSGGATGGKIYKYDGAAISEVLSTGIQHVSAIREVNGKLYALVTYGYKRNGGYAQLWSSADGTNWTGEDTVRGASEVFCLEHANGSIFAAGGERGTDNNVYGTGEDGDYMLPIDTSQSWLTLTVLQYKAYTSEVNVQLGWTFTGNFTPTDLEIQLLSPGLNIRPIITHMNTGKMWITLPMGHLFNVKARVRVYDESYYPIGPSSEEEGVSTYHFLSKKRTFTLQLMQCSWTTQLETNGDFAGTSYISTYHADRVILPPGYLSVSALDTTTVRLTWPTSPSDLANTPDLVYTIEMREEHATTWTVLPSVADTQVQYYGLFYTDVTLTKGKIYHFRVACWALTPDGSRVYSDFVYSAPYTCPDLYPPSFLSLKWGGGGNLVLSWDDRCFGETGFLIQVRNWTLGTGWTTVLYTAPNATTITLGGYFPNMIYQFRICGVTAAGIQTSYVESVTWPVAPVYQPVLTVTQVGLTIEGSFVDKNNIDAPAALYYVRKSTNGADFVNFQVIKASGIEFGKNIPYYDDLLVTYTFTDTDIIEGNHYVYIVIPWNGGGYLE